jgi:transcriptional regulator with XRE-family HTH domain
MQCYNDVIINYKKVGEKIRAERENLGLSREALAEKLNISSTYIGQIERGERKVRTENLYKISRFFHLSLDNILRFDEIKETPSGNNEQEINKIVDLLKRLNKYELAAIRSVIVSLLPVMDGGNRE